MTRTDRTMPTNDATTPKNGELLARPTCRLCGGTGGLHWPGCVSLAGEGA